MVDDGIAGAKQIAVFDLRPEKEAKVPEWDLGV